MTVTALSAQTPVFVYTLESAAYNDGDTPQLLDGLATVSDGGTISYQWQASGDAVTWTDLDGATSRFLLPPIVLAPWQIRNVTYYRVVATNFVDGLFPSEDLYPSDSLPPSDGFYASAASNAAKITVYPAKTTRSDEMIKFTDKRLFLKGTGNVVLTDPETGKIYYQSDKFSTAQINTSVDMNEIRAGLSNPIVAILPSNANLTVELTAADFSLWEKAAQVGADVTYGAPVPVAQTVTASGTTLSIDTSGGAPVAQLGFSDILCYVQTVGAASPIASDGVAYPVDPASGLISGFTATAQTQYKVWYWVQKATAQKANISTLMDPKIVHLTASFAVYANLNGAAASQSGTRQGWLYVTVPMLKLQANANISGDQTNADTTVISGMAIAADQQVVSALTDLCGDVGSNLAYYVYSPCVDADDMVGLAVVGGSLTLPQSSTAQIPVRFVMSDGSLVIPSSYSTGFTYTGSGLPSGTTVSSAGVVASGTTASSTGEVTIAYAYGETTLSCVINVVVSGD